MLLSNKMFSINKNLWLVSLVEETALPRENHRTTSQVLDKFDYIKLYQEQITTSSQKNFL